MYTSFTKKKFVKSNKNKDSRQSKEDGAVQTCQRLTGNEIENFYRNLHKGNLKEKQVLTLSDSDEDIVNVSDDDICIVSANEPQNKDICIVNLSDDTDEDICIVDEVKNNKKTKKYSKQNKLLKCIRSNDVYNLDLLIKNGYSINSCDEYGKSILMIAIELNSDDVIKYLLKNNADTNIKDRYGDTAVNLSKKYKNKMALKLLKQDNRTKSNILNKSWFCDICNLYINSTKNEHITSISHIMQSQEGNVGPSYSIPASNKGFQMLINQGWDSKKGLGPEGKGNLYPIKTHINKKRSGIGYKFRNKLK